METRSNFITRNEGFSCEACGEVVPAASGTCRNHCTRCLASKHVDDQVPGDRLNSCQGLMPAIKVEGTDPDKLDILHQCEICQAIKCNKAAPDDNREALFALFNGNTPSV